MTIREATTHRRRAFKKFPKFLLGKPQCMTKGIHPYVTPPTSESQCMWKEGETSNRRDVTRAAKREPMPKGRLNKQFEHFFDSPYDSRVQTAKLNHHRGHNSPTQRAGNLCEHSCHRAVQRSVHNSWRLTRSRQRALTEFASGFEQAQR